MIDPIWQEKLFLPRPKSGRGCILGPKAQSLMPSSCQPLSEIGKEGAGDG